MQKTGSLEELAAILPTQIRSPTYSRSSPRVATILVSASKTQLLLFPRTIIGSVADHTNPTLVCAILLAILNACHAQHLEKCNVVVQDAGRDDRNTAEGDLAFFDELTQWRTALIGFSRS